MTFSTNIGSLDSLNPSLRCGLSSNLDQIRPIVDLDNPDRAAIELRDQCVALAGLSSNVATRTCSTLSKRIDGGRPGRGSSTNPSSRFATNRPRHCVASDFVSHLSVLIRPHLMGFPFDVGGSGYVRERAEFGAEEASCETVPDAVAKVRDLVAAGPPGSDDGRGRVARAGGSFDDRADPHGGQGRSVGGVGGFETGAGRQAA